MPKKLSVTEPDHSVPSQEVYPAIAEMLMHALEWSAEQADGQVPVNSDQLPAISVEAV